MIFNVVPSRLIPSYEPHISIYISTADKNSVAPGASINAPLTHQNIDILEASVATCRKFLADLERRAEIEARIAAEMEA